jgi:hypothetical protein
MNEERSNILKEEKEILEKEKSLLESLDSKVGMLATAIQRARVDEYTSMITRPWKFFFINFAAGIFRGLGMAIGFTIVAAIVLYFVAKLLVAMVDLPIIGMYIGEVVKFVEQYIQQGMPSN